MTNFDDIDLAIILILKENSRTSFREIRAKLGISIGTIHNRITKLKENGIIEGYSLKVFDYGLLKPLDFILQIYKDILSLEENQQNYTKEGFIEELNKLLAFIPKYQKRINKK